MKIMNLLFAAAICLSWVASAPAAIVVDQSQLIDTVYMAGFSQPDLAQSFQQSFDNITGASAKLRSDVGFGVGDITIQIYDNLPNAGGNLLGTGTDFGVSPGDFAVVVFGGVISVVPDTTLYLVFSSSNSSLGLSGSTSNPYPRGQVFANGGFGSFPSFDYTFETFADDSIAAVPEPASMLAWGLIVGVGAVGSRVRKRTLVAAA